MQRLLLVVRHGEAEGNRDHRFIGQEDVPLSDLGRKQAEAVADRLERLGVDRIVASDLARARDTGTPLANRLGLPIEEDPRLREIRNGDWRMRLPQEIADGWPDLWARYRAGEDVPRPGGETWADVGVRVRSALDDLADGDCAVTVVFAHGGPVLWSVYWALGMAVDSQLFHGPAHPASNASITTIGLPGPKLRSFNETSHLPGDLMPEGDLLPFFR
ncbi:MAG: histidine phosphatase family protein [Acidimicrobiia bacterium]|nr:histidine phosphatase family protein [Acidimicrobiia bacterium]